MNKVKRVGLFISKDNEYNKEIYRGAYEACQELNCELIIFFGGTIDNNSDEFESISNYQKTIVYAFAKKMSLDFLLIPPTTICRTQKKLREQFIHFFDLPVIILNSMMDGYSYVCYDNRKGVKEAVDYMIEKCHCQHIGMLTAYKDSQGSSQRFKAYQESLKDHNLEYHSDYVLYVSNYMSFDNQIIDEWLSQHPQLDGIMCTTDSLALQLYNNIKKAGKRIGVDIMIAAFDDIPEAKHAIPQLSSCHVDASLLGYLGVINGYQQMKTHQIFQKNIDSHFIPRMSVHNGIQKSDELLQFVSYCQNNHYDFQYIAEGITNYIFDEALVYSLPIKNMVSQLFYKLLQISNEDLLSYEFKEEIGQLIYQIFHFEHIQFIDLERTFQCFSLILDVDTKTTTQEKENMKDFIQFINSKVINCYQRILSKKERDHFIVRQYINKINVDTMMVDHFYDIYDLFAKNLLLLKVKNAQLYMYPKPIVYYKLNNFDIPNEMILKIKIDNGQIQTTHKIVSVKNILSQQSLQHSIVSSLYFNEYQYGLLICDMPIQELSTIEYISTQFGTSLNMKFVVQELNKSSMTDELTKVYNRRGLYHHIDTFIQHCDNQDLIYLCLADLDNLKKINDTYGHDYGDKAILLAKDIIQRVFHHDSIIGRIGGDEFIVIFKSQGISFITQIEYLMKTITKELNDQYQYPFEVNMSYGVSVFDKEEKENHYQRIIDIADALMYERKKNKSIDE